jgi:hypothetical protein
MATRIVLLVVGACLTAVPSTGHHSFAAYYHEEQSVSIEGDIVEFEYRNPHAWVHVLAVDKQGQGRRVSAEWSNPNRLAARGITRDTLRPGDRVIVSGSPSRNPSEYRMHLKRIERPADGWVWAGGPARR